MAIVGGNVEQKDLGLAINLTGTHSGTEIDPVTGYLQLKVKEVSANLTNIYESEGTWTSDVIDLGDSFLEYGKVFTTEVSNGSSSIAVETRTSDDGATWEDWTAVAMDGTIQSVKKQMIQTRIKIFAGYQTDVYLISDFDNVADVDLLTPKDFIKTSNGLRLKRDYEFDMTLDTAWTGEGSLHRKLITRDEWVRIDKMNVLSKGEVQ